MAGETVNYEVPNMQLIVQDQNMACWFASAMMLIDWKERNRPGNSCQMIDDDTIKIYKANKGIGNAQILPLAKRLGLEPVPPMTPSVEGLRTWLMHYGPLWTNGISHIVVIAGVRGSPTTPYEVKVYDPWPGKGIGWRSLSGWYEGFDPNKAGASTRDTGKDVQAVFLRVPDA